MAAALDLAFEALAEPTRRRVVELLKESPRRAGDLAEAFGATAPAMSRHLRMLRRCGLVEEYGVDDDARVRMYRLRKEPFDELETWLREVARFWEDQLGSFKAHAEKTRGRKQRSRS